MSAEIAKIKSLPQISDLYDIEKVETLFKHDQFNLLMSQPPKTEWIKTNAYAGNSKYIPIGVVETLIQRIFKEYRIEILREGQMFNAVYAVVRVHYLHPVTSEWTYMDGLGSDQIQTKAGASAADLQSISNNAVAMSLPKAVSYAIRDAMEHVGPLFGRDLNRKDIMSFGVDKNLDTDGKYEELLALYIEKQDLIAANDFDDVTKVVNNKTVKAYQRMIDYLKNLKTPE